MITEELAVKAENISKVYRIGLKEKQNDSLTRTIVDFIKSPIRNFRTYRSYYKFTDMELDKNDSPNGSKEGIIWALKDIFFEVKKGEALGIIGRNGAGKSTLLKVLSRITEPTTGRIQSRGTISSLLEVGTGFHPELTGRENIYLNATILGMKKKEVDDKYDEIVEFSGISKFIDTPVKRYSSGMRVRLAFSVAAHLDPDILIIDEVLAVGDAEFQKKCLRKMEDVSQEGRTVIFVSHNMPAINRLCDRAILIDQGSIVKSGPSTEVVSEYLSSGSRTTAAKEWVDMANSPGKDIVKLNYVKVLNSKGIVSEQIDIKESFRVQMKYQVLKDGYVLLPHFYFWNQYDVCVFGTLDNDPNWSGKKRKKGVYISTVVIPGNFLADGMMYVNAALVATNPFLAQFWERSVVAFYIYDSGGKDTARGEYVGEISGVVRPLLQWNTQYFR